MGGDVKFGTCHHSSGQSPVKTLNVPVLDRNTDHLVAPPHLRTHTCGEWVHPVSGRRHGPGPVRSGRLGGTRRGREETQGTFEDGSNVRLSRLPNPNTSCKERSYLQSTTPSSTGNESHGVEGVTGLPRILKTDEEDLSCPLGGPGVTSHSPHGRQVRSPGGNSGSRADGLLNLDKGGTSIVKDRRRERQKSPTVPPGKRNVKKDRDLRLEELDVPNTKGVCHGPCVYHELFTSGAVLN